MKKPSTCDTVTKVLIEGRADAGVTVQRVSHDHPGRSMAAGRQTCMALERSWEFTSRPRSMGWMRDFETSKPSPHHMPPLTRTLPDPCQSLTTGALVFKRMWSCEGHSHSPNRLTFAFCGGGLARKLRLDLTVFPNSSPELPLSLWSFCLFISPAEITCTTISLSLVGFCFSCLFVQYRISLCSPG